MVAVQNNGTAGTIKLTAKSADLPDVVAELSVK
jgi:hypothetical protein